MTGTSCADCGRPFGSPKALADHRKAKHAGGAAAVLCDYCQKPATLHASSAFLYRGRDYGPVWACMPCQAWVGCHDGTTRPYGRLADAELRQAKSAAHAAFDPLWKTGIISRAGAYAELAARLGLDRKACHIGMFGLEQCRQVAGIAQAIAEDRRFRAATLEGAAHG